MFLLSLILVCARLQNIQKDPFLLNIVQFHEAWKGEESFILHNAVFD